MSKAAQTRQFIIEKAAPVFNLKGYSSTSLADIQSATRLTKGAIYGNFADKNELAIAAFEFSSSLVIGELTKYMNETPTAGDALMAYAEFYVQNWSFVRKKGGCPLMNAAVEADDHLHFMRKAVQKRMKQVLQLLKSVIEQGQAKKEFKSSVNAGDYAATIFGFMEGAILLAKIMDNNQYFTMTADRIKRVIDQELRR